MSIFICRRTNELKAEIDIPDGIIMKFRQFWSDFKDTPLKGATNLIDTPLMLLFHRGRQFLNVECLRELLFHF